LLSLLVLIVLPVVVDLLALTALDVHHTLQVVATLLVVVCLLLLDADPLLRTLSLLVRSLPTVVRVVRVDPVVVVVPTATHPIHRKVAPCHLVRMAVAV